MLTHEDFTLRESDRLCTATFQRSIDMERMMTLKPELEARAEQINKPLIVDMTAVDFLDSAAVGILAILFRQTQKQGLGIAFAGAQPQAEAVLAMVGLSDLVPLFENRVLAEAYLLKKS